MILTIAIVIAQAASRENLFMFILILAVKNYNKVTIHIRVAYPD
jgi:hypothetical protein